ncbi:RelA/SpoT domain-containing protein [Streptomyces sp. NPDC053253]|uniref:RelA/SpoT domain-containing protein n=1 Tax=Streptomyces sp. NPDC053253 TaxID=3365699 RepID=UPI0037CFEFEA
MRTTVSASFRGAYSDIERNLEVGREWLEARLKADLHEFRPVSVKARVKEVDSLFAKLQKGDYTRMLDVEDLLAARAVFLHPADVKSAIKVVEDAFPTKEARNVEAGKPDDFRYQQPHLIIGFPPSYIDRHPELADVKIELQFTTYIQHALQESTHDVIYKGSRFSWREARLDGRLRGLLEIVDDVLANISNVAQVDPDPAYELFDRRNAIIDFAAGVWDESTLPSDMRRFAITVEGLLRAAGVNVEELSEMVGKHQDIVGALSLNSVDKILGILLRERFDELLRGTKARKILISKELEDMVPSALKWPQEKRVSFS